VPSDFQDRCDLRIFNFLDFEISRFFEFVSFPGFLIFEISGFTEFVMFLDFPVLDIS